jgi:CBS domain-containing protein
MAETQIADYMVARDFLNALLPPLKKTDTVRKAMDWMNQFRVSQLAVVEEGEYLGMITEEALLDSTQLDATIDQFPLKFKEVYVTEYQHFYEVIKIAHTYHIQIVPILDEFGKYKGVISLNDTTSALANTYALQDPGGILVLSMQDYDYSMAEIARLIESNDAKILSSYVAPDPLEPRKMKLTLKLNSADLTRIIATLERFDYDIVASFHHAQPNYNNQERLDMFFRYLDM